ncbi:SPOR domain-containing protein [Ruegeria sediminis]|uniref:SPOR domain-containing protein n=1 Tax=Ruegeria sediminis TaxID=2583820 RepID=A0ABY2WV65_9RHOB|nr:SPOR domain-containing protein [Ruegeria sediminis]TMV06483.1 SPOR domain-containing protein [Ruegeria sediminis]
MANFDYSGRMGPEHVRYTDQFHQPGDFEPEDDLHYEADNHPQGAGGLGRIVNIAGAVGSLALIVGIGVWGYKLVMRDVSGVPVVRAVEGPMRIQPENPGGTPADHQGLAVNTVAAEGTAAPPPDRLILAPRPVTLTDEDAPMGELKPTPAVLVVEEDASNGQSADLRKGVVESPDPELTDPGDQELVETEQSDEDLAALEEPEKEPAIDPVDWAAQQAEIAGLDAPGVASSPRPQRRPARAIPSRAEPSASAQAAIDAAVMAAVGMEMDADALPVGTRLAQLGAFESAEIAQAEWDRLYGRFGEYLDGRQRVIQKASSGGRTFYRLRALGFDDLSDSRQFCAALVAQGADCIPVTVR